MKLYHLPIISFCKYTGHYKYRFSLPAAGNKKAGQRPVVTLTNYLAAKSHNEGNNKIMMIADLL